ncbi:hypothetical protein JZ751_001484 [Albula glossodonta]|uniref:Uncharacterized protein n=1 Tax=Albula glossodonta TaxID=121402 RepID=A0A8T2PTX6_9TELE|nr:hypothetical protein JZ751_001484 [Albula glossodonta]
MSPPGGSIKTEAEADKESLQAQWWDRESPLPLRCRDILCLIDAGLKYRENPWFPPVLPVDIPCHLICQRLLLTFSGSDGNPWVLQGGVEEAHLPVIASVQTHIVTWACHRLVKECMPSSCHQLHVKFWGILGLQHSGRIPGKTDGICFNMMVSVEYTGEGPETSQPPPLESPRFQWHKGLCVWCVSVLCTPWSGGDVAAMLQVPQGQVEHNVLMWLLQQFLEEV